MTSVGVQNFHRGFHAPFSISEQAESVAGGAFPFPVSIGDHNYVMDLKQWKHQTLEQFRNQSDTSREPGEQSLSIEGVWKRTGTSSVRGAGQRFYDDDTSDRLRFFRSAGVDPWAARGVKLLHATTKVFDLAVTNARLLNVGGVMLLAEGQSVAYSADPLTPGTWHDNAVTAGGPTYDVLAWTTNGTKVFVALGAGGIRTITPGVFFIGANQLGSYQATFILYGNGWLIGTKDNDAVIVNADGTTAPLMTHRNPGFVWSTGASAPNAIYLAGNAGDRAEIYRTNTNDDGSSLVAPIFAGELPAGEIVLTMAYYDTIVVIGTSAGLRIASINTDGSLAIGAVIQDESRQGVRAIEARGQYAWVSHVNPTDGNLRGLARVDLAHNTEDLVPAWAADLASDENDGVVTGIATWVEADRDYRLFVLSGHGLYAESDDLVQEGTLDLGWLGMGSPESKSLASVSVAHESLRGTVTVRVENEKGQDVEATSEAQGTWASTEMKRPLIGELMDLSIVLTRDLDDPTLGPVLRRWTARVVPAPASVDEIFVPILLADSVRDSGSDVTKGFDPFSELRYLKGLENSRTIVPYREGRATYLVTVRSVGMDGGEDWSSARRFINGVLMVRLITLEGVPPQLPGGIL